MLSPKLKADIRKLWDRFWAGGIANPLTAIEQITYLVFLKRLEDLDRERRQATEQAGRSYQSIYEGPDGETYRWSYIRRLKGEEQLKHVRGPVFNWLRAIEGAEDRMRDAALVIANPNLLEGAIEIIDNLFVLSRNQDTLGDIYEMLLDEIAVAGKNGQFRTPRHIIRVMCDLVDPQFGESICDPACGTAGFLINAYQHILKCNIPPDKVEFEADGTPVHLYRDQLLSSEKLDELRRNHFYGFDFDRTMVRLGWMNMIQHGLENPQIENSDTLGSRFNEQLVGNGGKVGNFDVVLANPPFTGNIDENDIGKSLQPLQTSKTELLFVELILQLLRTGGRAAVIVPEGLLFGSTRAHRTLRKKLVTENQLNAVISLPGGVFQPYAGVKTSLLLFNRDGSTDEVWFYEVGADGLTLNAKRSEQYERNDLWDLTLKYRLRYAQPAPAFVDGDTWRQWQSYDEATRRRHYLQPRIATRTQTDREGELVTAPMLVELATESLAEDKEWSAGVPTLTDNDLNLSAGRYKPFSLETAQYDPPAQIIRELQEMESQIQNGLTEIIEMIEVIP